MLLLHPLGRLGRMVEADRLTWELAAATAGAVARRAAREVGMYGELLGRRLRDGALLAPTPRVLLLPGAPETFERDAWVGLHDAGPDAGITHDTSLALFGVPGFELRPIHISRSRTRSTPSAAGVILHRPRLWPVHHRLLLNGMPVASPTRALFDLANEGETHVLKLERTFNNAWGRGLTSGQKLVEMAAEWCERGRRGSAFIHEYLDRHPIAWQPPQSNLENRFRQIIVDAGMPEPRRQINLGDQASWIGRVDFLDPRVPLIAEINSDLFHTAPLDAESDADREARLKAAGFEVEQFKEFDVWHNKHTVIARWQDARRRAACRRT
jgi:very-short-patch-repair endonuclease